jgi:hypothetical protein
MSRFTEIQNQYQGYVAAKEAVKKTDPGIAGVVDKKDGGSRDGAFYYDPGKDIITIFPNGHYASSINISSGDMPAFIKALREFFE